MVSSVFDFSAPDDSSNTISDDDIVVGIYDADSDTLISVLEEGTEVPLSMSASDSLTIAAVIPEESSLFGEVESIFLDLNDGAVTRIENVEPYALFGNRGEDFAGGQIPVGDNTIELELFSQNQLRGSSLGTVTRSFTIVDDSIAPPIVIDDELTVFESEAEGDIDINVLANDQSGTGDPIAVVGAAGDGGPADPGSLGGGIGGFNGGIFIFEADGSVDFDAFGDFEFLAAGETATTPIEFGVGYENGTDPVVISDLIVTVVGENDSPIAADDEAVAQGSSTVIDVLSNDRDPDTSDVLAIADVTTPNEGTVVISGESLIYLPNEVPFDGTDSFDYTISDGNGGIDTATVSITGENFGIGL